MNPIQKTGIELPNPRDLRTKHTLRTPKRGSRGGKEVKEEGPKEENYEKYFSVHFHPYG
jgi:hypothetical protein